MKYTGEYTYNFKGKNIVFKYISSPTIIQKMDTVDDIVNGVVSDTVGYEPILFDYFLTVALVNNFTNIDLPKSFSESAEFIEASGIKYVLYDVVPKQIIDDIVDAAEKKIEFRKSQIAHSSKLDELFAALTMVVNKYGETFEGLNVGDIVEKLSSINEMAKMPQEKIVSTILQYEDKKKKELE